MSAFFFVFRVKDEVEADPRKLQEKSTLISAFGVCYVLSFLKWFMCLVQA